MILTIITDFLREIRCDSATRASLEAMSLGIGFVLGDDSKAVREVQMMQSIQTSNLKTTDSNSETDVITLGLHWQYLVRPAPSLSILHTRAPPSLVNTPTYLRRSLTGCTSSTRVGCWQYAVRRHTTHERLEVDTLVTACLLHSSVRFCIYVSNLVSKLGRPAPVASVHRWTGMSSQINCRNSRLNPSHLVNNSYHICWQHSSKSCHPRRPLNG